MDRHCAHRRADLSLGMVEQCGLRCHYHGWAYDRSGQCIAQLFEDTTMPERNLKISVALKAYPVQTKGGLVWTYMGPAPAPLLPDWEPFSWDNGFVQVVLTEVPCNWFQCQENSIDPVHFEWMHENWGKRLRDGPHAAFGPTHLKLAFEEFEHGFVYKRVKQDTSEADAMWTVGRVFLWPHGFFLGEHFEWRVPIDDENTLSVTWKYTRVPKERQPYVQGAIPTWHGPLTRADGSWIDTHVMNQDFIAWVGQGKIADRTGEHLGASDRGIVMVRRRFFEEMERIAQGNEAKGTIRDAQKNICVALPIADRESVLQGYTSVEILADPRKRMMFTSYVFQAGQPEQVKQQYALAMGLPVQEFTGLDALRKQ